MTAYRDQSEVIFPVVQTAHGFSPGQALRRDTTSWVKALADTSANGSMVGVVDRVINANTFYLRLTGKITGLSGLTSGTTYYLSTTTPGALSPTAPSTVGQLYRPVLVADSATSGYVYNDAGMVVGTGPLGPAGPQGPPGPDMAAASLWDAKGDLALGTGPDTAIRLPVGTDNYLLTADSTQATGVKWAAAPSGMPGGGVNGQVLGRTGGAAAWRWESGPSFNVKDYGALGDGAANDAPAINAAISAAAPTGGTVFLPAGQYRINSAIDFSPVSSYPGRSVTLQGSSGFFDLFGTYQGTTVIDSYTGTSAIKAVGTSSNNYPTANLRNFKIRVCANQGVGVPTVDWYWVENGFLLENVAVQFWWQSGTSGPLCTGDGIRIVAPQYGWEVKNCCVASVDLAQGKTDGRAFILSDGSKPDGSGYYNPATDGVGYKQSAGGVFTSCLAGYLPIGYSCTGDITGVTFNSCKSMPNGVTSVHSSLGVEVNRCEAFTFNGMHMECHSGTSEGLRLYQVGVYPRNIRYQGVIWAPVGAIGLGARIEAGKDCDIDVVFRGGTFNEIVQLGPAASNNHVRWATDASFTGSALITDYSTSGDNLVRRGTSVTNYYSAGTGTTTNGAIVFASNGSLAINNPITGGRLGQKLELNQSANYGGAAMNTWANDVNMCPLLDFNKSRSATMGTQTVVVSGDNLGIIDFRGSDGSAFQTAARVTAFVDATPGANDMPGRLSFHTTPDGTTALTERLRIDNKGNVVVMGALLAANATDGFLYLPAITPAASALPTGAPTGFANRAPIAIDATNNRIVVYLNGVWKYAALT
jgi:pectate lyase-like protein